MHCKDCGITTKTHGADPRRVEPLLASVLERTQFRIIMRRPESTKERSPCEKERFVSAPSDADPHNGRWAWSPPCCENSVDHEPLDTLFPVVRIEHCERAHVLRAGTLGDSPKLHIIATGYKLDDEVRYALTGVGSCVFP